MGQVTIRVAYSLRVEGWVSLFREWDGGVGQLTIREGGME